MNPQQMVDYLGTQIKTLGDNLLVANQTQDREKINAAMVRMQPQIEFLRGYATSLEHAGHLPKRVVDDLFETFDSAANSATAINEHQDDEGNTPRG